MADSLLPTDVNDALDGQSDEAPGGALSQVAEQPAAVARTAPAALFGDNKYQDKLFDLLSKPPVDTSSKWLAFAGAMGAPTKTGSFSESLGGGLSALAKGQSEEEALKQRYREAMIAQYSRLAMQQNALGMIPGMTPGAGSAVNQGGQPSSPQAGTPRAVPISNSAQSTTEPAADPWDEKVPGYYGLTKRDVAGYINSDPTGKSLLAAREKRATTSDRAGSIAMNLDPNTGDWVANQGAITAAALLKSTEAQINAGAKGVRVPNSNNTETYMSEADALHLHGKLTTLPGLQAPTAPNGGRVGDIATLADQGVLKQASMMPPGPDRDAIIQASQQTSSGPAMNSQGGPGGVVAGTTQLPEVAAGLKASAEYSATIPKQINDEAENALQSQTGLVELQNLLKNFNPGKAAPVRQALTEYAAQSGLTVDQAALNAAGSMEAFNKIALGLVTQAAKQFSSRPTQLEFQKILEASPSIALLPEGLQKIMVFNMYKNNKALEKQQAFYDWSAGKPPTEYAKFLPYWNRKQMDNLRNPTSVASMDQVAKPAIAQTSPQVSVGKIGTPTFDQQTVLKEMQRRFGGQGAQP